MSHVGLPWRVVFVTTLPVELALHVDQLDGGIRGTVQGPDGAVEPFAGWLELTARIARVLACEGERDQSSVDRPAR
jgi:hypothetical protein